MAVMMSISGQRDIPYHISGLQAHCKVEFLIWFTDVLDVLFSILSTSRFFYHLIV